MSATAPTMRQGAAIPSSAWIWSRATIGPAIQHEPTPSALACSSSAMIAALVEQSSACMALAVGIAAGSPPPDSISCAIRSG